MSRDDFTSTDPSLAAEDSKGNWLNPERDAGIKPRASPRTRGQVDAEGGKPSKRVAAVGK